MALICKDCSMLKQDFADNLSVQLKSNEYEENWTGKKMKMIVLSNSNILTKLFIEWQGS